QPRWKGKMGMDQDADDYVAALLDYYGDEKGKQLLKNLGAQQLNIRKGRSLVSQLVAAGEFPIQIDAHHHEATALRQVGARAASSRRRAADRFHAVEARPGNRLQTAPLAGVQRPRRRRPRRRRQSK